MNNVKTILITGATGFIGSNLIKELIKQDVKIYAIVLPGEEKKIVVDDKVKIVKGDLGAIDLLKEELGDNTIDLIYHLAWVGVSTTYKNDVKIQMKNIEYALNVMELASVCNCSHVVATGSVSEYAYSGEKVNGKQIPSPGDMYAATKAAIHIYCDLYARQHNINFNWLLISSIYGPGREDNNLITYTIKSLLHEEKASYTKLEQRWDYVYIDDLINAMLLVGERGKTNEVYAIGSGDERQLSEYVTVIKDKIAPDAVLGIGEIPYKTARIDNSLVEIDKLQEDTGFVPQVSFERGIETTIEYFRETEKRNV